MATFSSSQKEQLLAQEEARIDVAVLTQMANDVSQQRTYRFKDTVMAIYAIVEGKLYKTRYSSLESYFADVWHISRAQVYRFYNCARVLRELHGMPLLPNRERLCRSLKRYGRNKQARRLLWKTVIDRMKTGETTLTSNAITNAWHDLVARKMISGNATRSANDEAGGGDESETAVLAPPASSSAPTAPRARMPSSSMMNPFIMPWNSGAPYQPSTQQATNIPTMLPPFARPTTFNQPAFDQQQQQAQLHFQQQQQQQQQAHNNRGYDNWQQQQQQQHSARHHDVQPAWDYPGWSNNDPGAASSSSSSSAWQAAQSTIVPRVERPIFRPPASSDRTPSGPSVLDIDASGRSSLATMVPGVDSASIYARFTASQNNSAAGKKLASSASASALPANSTTTTTTDSKPAGDDHQAGANDTSADTNNNSSAQTARRRNPSLNVSFLLN